MARRAAYGLKLTRRRFLELGAGCLGVLGLGRLRGIRPRAHQTIAYAEEDSISLTIDTGHLGNVFLEGEEVLLRAIMRVQEGLEGNYTLRYDVRDARNRSVLRGTEEVTLSKGVDISQVLRMGNTRHGYYSATFELLSDTEVVVSAATSLAVVPPPLSGIQPSYPWGIGGGGAFIGIRFDELEARQRLQLVHQAGIAFTREEIFWDSVEPSQGEFHWEVFDPAVMSARQQGVLMLGLLDYFASWSVPYGYGGQEGNVDFDTAVANYANYVYQVVSRYKPGGLLAQQAGWTDGYGIQYWEVWNEPPTFWFGTAEQFGLLVRAAADAIRRADPSATVVVSSGGPSFDATAIAVAGIDSYDALAIHLYPGPTGPETGGFVQSVRDTRKFLDEHGGKSVAIWITEMGWDTYGGVSEWEQASYIVRANTQTVAAGSSRNLVFTFNYGSEPPGWGIVHPNLTPKPAYAAYATLTHLLGSAQQYGEVPMGSAIRAYVFEIEEGSVAVLWSVAEAGEIALGAPNSLTAYDMMHAPVGEHSNNKLVVPLEGGPTFVTGEGVLGAQMRSILAQGVVSGITPLGLEIAGLDDLPTNLPPLRVTVTNRINLVQEGIVQLSLPEGWQVENASLPFGPLDPGQSITLTYRLQKVVTNSANAYPVTAKATTSDGREVSTTRRLFATAAVRGTPVINGALSDWGPALPVMLDSPDQVVGLPNWSPEDLSAEVRVMWDDEHLFFAARVTDDVFSQHNTDGNIWMGDSIQLFFDPLDDGGTSPQPDDQEWGIALTSDGPQVYRWRGDQAPGLVETAELVAKRGARGNIIYELAIPLSELAPLEPRNGTRMGFTFLVNEDDGSGREGWMALTPGVGNAWNPSLFATWWFVDAISKAAMRIERRAGRQREESIVFELPQRSARLVVHNHGMRAIELGVNGSRLMLVAGTSEHSSHHIALWGDTALDLSPYVLQGRNTLIAKPLGRPEGWAVLEVY